MSEWQVRNTSGNEGAFACPASGPGSTPCDEVIARTVEGRGEGLRAWVERLERSVWEDPAGLAQLPAQLRQAGLPARTVLAQLPSDESLALLIKQDCLRPEAFEELFVRRYAAYLLRWFGHWSKDEHVAADLTQQTFCSFLETRLERFDPSRSFRAYLYQAAFNLFKDHERKRKRTASLESVPEPPSRAPAPDLKVLEAELDDQIARAIRGLPSGERQVLQAALDGQPTAETARSLGIGVPQVYALLYAARRHMEAALEIASQKRPYRKTSHERESTDL
jgi:RNA polymerase sigma-70 factor (ECF subfamily)